jgi:glycosyltransferase involved in cell wall biosynthesis
MTSVSVGIAALNEGSNIKQLLMSILNQQMNEYELLEVIVVSDGSTDNTVQEVKAVNSTLIKLIDYPNRAGKMKRFNEIFKIAKGDIVISIDADVLPEDDQTFYRLLQNFKDPQVAFASGRSKPLKARNFIESSINVSRLAWDTFRDSLKNGDGVYASNGKFYAITKQLASEITFPEQGSGDQGYIYLKCLKLGYKSKGCKDAKILFRSPNNLTDHIKQINRYEHDYGWRDEFGNMVDEAYYIPTSMIYKEKLRIFIKYPLHSLFIFIVNVYAKYIFKSKVVTEQHWEIQNSTKEAINVN